MKKVFLNILVLAFLCLNIPAAKALNLPAAPQDTITIQIGQSKKIIIWVDDKEDLTELQAYDINKMIRELGETVDSLDNAERVLIITDENGKQYKVEVEEDEAEVAEDWYKHEKNTDPAPRDTTKSEKRFEYNFHFNKDDDKKGNNYHSKHFGTRHFIDFDLGMNNYVNSAGEIPNSEQYSLRPWGSWYVGINSNFRTHIAGPLALQWGAGVDWYNFKFEDDATRLLQTTERVEFYREPNSEVRSIKSKLTASYVNLNFVPMLDFRYKSKLVRKEGSNSTEGVRKYKSDAFRIGLGGYAGYRIGSYAKYKFDDGDTRKEKDRSNFYLNNWRYGMRLQIGFKGVDLFANYDLNELFTTGRGPELHGLSFGLTL
jgi:hypothetical protein